MQVVLQIDQSDDRTLQQQVFHQIRSLILDGRLRSGDPVPASRELSQQLGVSRNTVVIAYDQLLSEGYLESKAGVGTFVSSALPERSISSSHQNSPTDRPQNSSAPTLDVSLPSELHRVVSPAQNRTAVDFWVGKSDPKSFPTREWRRILDTKIRYSNVNLTYYPDWRGLKELRFAISDHLGPARGVGAQPDEILCTSGSQDALALIARGFAESCNTLIHEMPCYHGVTALFRSLGYKTHGIPVDDNGMIVSQLPDLRNALVYVTPSHQYPTGVTLSLERRLQLLEWAVRTNSIIIEDDYNGDFRYEGAPLTALHGLSRTGSVIYVGTFSKSFGPALRLGYMVGSAHLIKKLSRWQSLLSNGRPWLEQAAMAEFISSGGFRRHLRRIRALYMSRRNVLMEELYNAFANAKIHGRRGGMHLSVRLPGLDVKHIQKSLLERGIAIYCVDDCGADCTRMCDGFDDMLILGYAAVSEKNIKRTVTEMVAATSSEATHDH